HEAVVDEFEQLRDRALSYWPSRSIPDRLLGELHTRLDYFVNLPAPDFRALGSEASQAFLRHRANVEHLKRMAHELELVAGDPCHVPTKSILFQGGMLTDLLAHMKEFSLSFAPAGSIPEGARTYMRLHQLLVDQLASVRAELQHEY